MIFNFLVLLLATFKQGYGQHQLFNGKGKFQLNSMAFVIPRARGCFVSFSALSTSQRSLFVSQYVQSPSERTFCKVRLGSIVNLDGLGLSTFVTPDYTNVFAYIMRFGEKYYKFIYTLGELTQGDVDDSAVPFETNVHVKIADEHNIGLRNWEEQVLRLEILGPFRILFHQAKYHVGDIADAGIILPFYNHGKSTVELFPIISLENPYPSYNGTTVYGINHVRRSFTKIDINANDDGYKGSVNLEFSDQGHQVTLLDLDLVVGETTKNQTWVTFLHTTDDYIYIEMTPFGIVQPNALDCKIYKQVTTKMENKEAVLQVTIIPKKKECNSDIKNVVIEILPEMKASIKGPKFQFDKESLLLPYTVFGTSLNVTGTISIGYKLNFTVKYEMPTNKPFLDVFTSIRYKSMKENSPKNFIKSEVHTFQKEKEEIDHDDDRTDIYEVSVVEFKRGFIACNYKMKHKNSGCYHFDLRHPSVKVIGHGMVSIFGVNEKLNSIYGSTAELKTMSLNLDTLRISYLSSVAFEKIEKSKKFRKAKVIGHGMVSLLGVNEKSNSIYGLTVEKKTISLNLNTLRISYLLSTAFEKIKNSKQFRKAQGFTRKELYEKERHVLDINGELLKVTYYGVFHKGRGHYLFIWLREKDCVDRVANREKLSLKSCKEILSYCPYLTKVKSYWIHKIGEENKPSEKVCYPRSHTVVLVKDETKLTKNKLITTIPKITKQYFLSFDISGNLRCNNQYCSIMHFTKGCANGVNCRIPGIWTKPPIIHFCFNNIDRYFTLDPPFDFPESKWTTINVHQFKDDDKYFLNITIDGVVKVSYYKINPPEISDVKCYVANPWDHIPSNGFIRNAWIKLIED